MSDDLFNNPPFAFPDLEDEIEESAQNAELSREFTKKDVLSSGGIPDRQRKDIASQIAYKASRSNDAPDPPFIVQVWSEGSILVDEGRRVRMEWKGRVYPLIHGEPINRGDFCRAFYFEEAPKGVEEVTGSSTPPHTE